MTTMRAVVHDRYGDASVLRIEEVAVPTPKAGEVLLRVRAASVNPADVITAAGSPAVVRVGNGLTRPKKRVRGMDVAGTIEAVGEGVTRWSIGDAVFGQGVGTFAEFAVAREDSLAALPPGVPFEHGASVAVAGISAQIALEISGLKPGDRLLINGAAGGIGQFAVQMAKNQGFHVTGVCSTHNVERVQGLGADVVLDYAVDDVLSPPEPYDCILDNAGSVKVSDWRRITRKDGVIMPNSGAPGPDGGAIRRLLKALVQTLWASQHIKTFYATVTTERLERFGEDLESGAVVPLVDTMFTLDHAAEAMRRVESHHARGKVIVTIPEVTTQRSAS